MSVLKVCWIGGARYTNPLNTPSNHKWGALSVLGVEMHVVGFSNSLMPRRFTQHAHFYLLPQMPVSVLRHFTLYLFGPLLVLWLIWRRGVRVLIAQSPYEGAAAALAKQIAGRLGVPVKLVVESHGNFELAVFAYRKVSFAGLYRRLMNRAVRYTLRHADLLRPVSNSTRNQLQVHAPDTPVVQFMAWVDADVFVQTPRQMPLSQSQTLLYVGVIAPVKGLHFLLDAFAKVREQCPKARLELIGRAQNEDYADSLKEQARRLGIARCVVFLGSRDQRDLAQHMARSRVLVLPSVSEGMPRIIAESMLCGLPVVASAVGGIPDVVHEGENGYLVPPEAVDALANALIGALRNRSIDAMGERARAFAVETFSAEAFVDGHRRVIDFFNAKAQRSKDAKKEY